jgi:hypothetical protein
MNYLSANKRSTAKRVALACTLIAAAVLAWMYHVATSDPIIRSTTVDVQNLVMPVRLVLVSDIHVAGPDMPPSRVRRIVEQINALRPDVIVIAGGLRQRQKAINA